MPFGDTYLATVSTRPPSGSATVFDTAARPKVCSPTSFARPASRRAAATISPGPAVPLSTSTASGPLQAERAASACSSCSSVRRPTSFATGPPWRKISATFGAVGGRAPGRAAQVEQQLRRALALERLDLGPHVLRGRGREVGDLDVAGPALEHAALRGGGQDPLAHDRHVERVGARAQDAELHRGAGGAAQEPLGHDRRHRPGVPLVDRLQDVAGRRPAFSAGEPGRAATTITNEKRRVSTRPTSASASFGGCW